MEPQNTRKTQKETFRKQEEHAPQLQDFPLKQEGYAILGAVFEVYREMGCGFLEAVYQECLERELELRGIPFLSKPTLSITYKSAPLRHTYEPDLICYQQIVLELKAVSQLLPEHRAQLHNYLKATSLPVGYLINFGHHPLVEYERVIRTRL